MRSVIIGFVIGVALLQQQATLLFIGWYFFGLLIAFYWFLDVKKFKLLSLCMSRYIGHNISLGIFTFVLSILAGFCWAGLSASWIMSEELPLDVQGKDIQLIGTISNLPTNTTQGTHFQFHVEEVLANANFSSSILKRVPEKISLAWFSSVYQPIESNQTNQTNQSNQTNQTNQTNQANRNINQVDTNVVVKNIVTTKAVNNITPTNDAIKPGQRWKLTVRLKRPHGNANPNGFDYEVWLLEQGIRATGTVQMKQAAMVKIETIEKAENPEKAEKLEKPEKNTESPNILLSDFVWTWSNVVERSRFLLRERINAALPHAPYAGVIVALVVGDQREIAQSDWQVFNRTGIGHLVSISGLHITMIAALFSGLMYFFWRHSFFTNAALPLKIPAQKIAALAGVLVALVYVALAGFGVPAQRTLLMLIVVAVAMWTGRLTNVTLILCWALGLVVLFDPWAVLWPGFWLSFFAVAILLYVSVGRSLHRQFQTIMQMEMQTGMKTPSHQAGILISTPNLISNSTWSKYWINICAAAHMQYAITIGLLPLTLLLFGQVSLISPIANALAIPLVSFVVTPLALLGSVLPSSVAVYVLSAAHFCMASLAQLLTYLSTSPIAVWQVPSPTPFMFLFALLGTLWLLMPRGWPVRFLGLFCWLPILLQADTAPQTGALQITAFDVGQGSSLLIETAQHRLLYDTGPAYSLESNSGTRVVLPYLQSRGINRLDMMVISHADNDHSGGTLSILNTIKVAQTYSSLPLDHAIVLQSTLAHRCQAGQSWEWDGVYFEMLHPTPASYDSTKWKTNARSCTLKISTQSDSILLAGDIEATQEDELVNMLSKKIAASVLLAPHHGSGTSSTLPFLQMVQPKLALFQVGYQNRYRHPKQIIWQRYLDLHIQAIRTDQSGAITLQFGAEKQSPLQVDEYRKKHARYWYQSFAQTH